MTTIQKIAEEHGNTYDNVFSSQHLENKLMTKYENDKNNEYA